MAASAWLRYRSRFGRDRFSRGFASSALRQGRLYKTFTGEFTTWDKLTFGEKVIAKGTGLSYAGILSAGIAGVGVIGYTLYKELVAPQAPNVLFSDTLTLLATRDEVQTFFRSPNSAEPGYVATPSISGSRMQNRRIHYEDAYDRGTGRMERRMVFYLEPNSRGTVPSSRSRYAVVHAVFQEEDDGRDAVVSHQRHFDVERYFPPSLSQWYQENVHPVLVQMSNYERAQRLKFKGWWNDTLGSPADAVRRWRYLYVYIDFIEGDRLLKQVYVVDNRKKVETESSRSWLGKLFQWKKFKFHN